MNRRGRSAGRILLLVLACILARGAEPTGFPALERRIGGRLGVVALDTGTGRRVAYRAEQRFALCSTFKLLLVAQVLARVDAGQEHLERVLPYGPGDLLDYAPITARHLAEGGLPIATLCAAALQYSDNTAANLLLLTQGGPAGLTQFLRALGDPSTRLDRNEPSLNTPVPGQDC